MAEQQALIRGVVCLSIGFLAFVIVRNSVYEPLRGSSLGQSGLVSSLFRLNLIQALGFLMLVYVPALIMLSNSISGDGLGFSISTAEYRTQVSALLPLWGMLLLIAAPVQWLAPQFVIIGLFGISIGLFILLLLMLVYTTWAIKELNYLSTTQSIGVLALSLFTLPVFYVLTAFLLALPFFIMIPLIYLGYQWTRTHFSAHTNARSFQEHLHALTSNPQDSDAHYQLGLIHLQRRNIDAARGYFTNALKTCPDDPDYHYALGRAYELQREWPQALQEYEETYRLNPEYGLGDIFREVGKSYLHTGLVEKSIEFLEFFLQRRESDPEGRYWLALALKQKGDTERMGLELNRILEQARSDPRFFRKKNREWLYRARSMLRMMKNTKFEM